MNTPPFFGQMPSSEEDYKEGMSMEEEAYWNEEHEREEYESEEKSRNSKECTFIDVKEKSEENISKIVSSNTSSHDISFAQYVNHKDMDGSKENQKENDENKGSLGNSQETRTNTKKKPSCSELDCEVNKKKLENQKYQERRRTSEKIFKIEKKPKKLKYDNLKSHIKVRINKYFYNDIIRNDIEGRKIKAKLRCVYDQMSSHSSFNDNRAWLKNNLVDILMLNDINKQFIEEIKEKCPEVYKKWKETTYETIIKEFYDKPNPYFKEFISKKNFHELDETFKKKGYSFFEKYGFLKYLSEKKKNTSGNRKK